MIWDQNDTANNRVLVKFSERCGTGAWSAPLTVQTPGLALKYQSLLSGNPNIAIDQVNSKVELSFAAMNTDDPALITDGDIVWARKSYASCP